MGAAILTFWSATVLLLVLQNSIADKVITPSCGPRGLGFRVRHYPTDTAATTLIAENCHLTDVDTDDFNGLPYILTIDLEQNDIGRIHPAAFRSVPRLKWLNLNRNKLCELPVFDNETCPNLSSLGLQENLLTILNNPKALSACRKLENLYFSKNNIEYLHPNLLSDLTELKKLLLDNNKITFIHDSLLTNNRYLEWFHVQNNRLAYLPNNLLSKHRFKEIDIENNPWNCACLLELLTDIKRKGVTNDAWIYNGIAPKCVYIGWYPCYRYTPSGLLHTSLHATEGTTLMPTQIL